MKLSRIGRITLAFVAMIAMGLSMTACGGFTVAYLWVLGTQYNQISAFKVDDYTGNLTPSLGSPYPSGGANPNSIAVRAGGRYVYVVNKGSGGGKTDGNIALFSVGGDGNLTYQQTYFSQGNTPIWASIDSSGNYLYVLDEFDPTNTPGNPAASGKGDITVFAIDPTTGRLALVTNTSVKVAGNTQLTYFPVGPNPTMMQISGNSCLFTMDTGDQTIFPYSIGSGGQLTLTTNSAQGITTGAANLTSITTNSGGNYVYLTDAAPTADSPGGRILPYTVGGSCALNSVTGGAVNNLPSTANPVWTLADSTGKFLYVLNQSSSSANIQNSSISEYSILSTGQLQPLPGAVVNPITVGSGPVCMIEDPSHQYVYTSNNIASTVTGKIIDTQKGYLSDLNRGPSFPTSPRPTCLGLSGNTD